MKYLKHKSYSQWVVKILPYKALIVWGNDITVSDYPKHYLDSEEYEPATADEFEKEFDSTILELKTLAQ